MSSNTKDNEVRADAKKDATTEVDKKDAGEASQVKKYDIGRKLYAFKRKLKLYSKIKTTCMAALKGEKVEKDSDAKAADADAEKKPVSKVHECYRLVRNFCVTYNFITSETRLDNYLFIPKDFKEDLKTLLSEETLNKFLAAMEGKVEDLATNLPGEFNDGQVKKVIDFIDSKDGEAIIGRLTKDIESLGAEFEALKAAKKAKAATSVSKASKKKTKQAPKKSANVTSSKESRSNSKTRDAAFCAETMFKDMISQIKKRVNTIRFQSEDYQTFSEV